MTDSEKVFDLIRSLSRGEKLNFKKYAGRHIINNGNRYVQLFDYMNKKVKAAYDYDESELKVHFKNEKFVKNLSEMKSYLYDQILRSLNTPEDNDARVLIQYAHILYAKGLKDQVEYMLKKAKHYACANEDFNTLLNVLELEYNFGIKFFNVNRKERLKKVLAGKKETVEKIINLNKYREFLLELTFFDSEEVLIRSEKEKKRTAKILKSPLMLSENEAFSNRAKLLYYSIKGMSYYSLGDFLNAYKHFEKLLKLIESTHLKKDITNYALILYDYIYMGLLMEKFKDVPVLLNNFETLLRKKSEAMVKSSRIIAYHFYYLIKLDLIIYTVNFHNCDTTLKEIEKFINENYRMKYTESSHLVFTLSTVYFAKGDYTNALYWINKYFNEFNFSASRDVMLGERLLSIFIHYELQNIELLQYLVRSLYHYLLKDNKVHKFEAILMRFIRKLPNVSSEEDFKELLIVLKKELITLKSDPFESRIFIEYFDYVSWVESKIENRPLLDILKRNFANRIDS